MKTVKRLLIGIIITIFLLSSIVAFSDTLPLVSIKQDLLFGRAFNRAFDPISPRVKGFDEKMAYKLQAWLVSRLIEMKKAKVIGYKVAFTSSPSQKKFGTDKPAYGVLLDYMKLRDGAVIDHTKIMKSFIEVEVGFRFGKGITKPIKDVETLKTYIDGVFPAVELPAIRFTTLKGVKAADVIADDAGTSYFIVGKVLKVESIDPAKIEGILTHNGKVVRKGNAKAVLGNPWNSLLWLVNQVIASGGKIEKGELVITGTMTPLYPLSPGSYNVTYGNLGKINFIVK